MSPELQKAIFKYQRKTLDDLSVLVRSAGDLDPVSFFRPAVRDGEVGFCDPGCRSNLMIRLPGPDEAKDSTHLHVEIRYSACPPHEVRYYRFEICWGCDVVLPPPAGDYLRETMLCLRRGVRFDYHPKSEDPRHPRFHWHPNGCSEFRMVSGEMTALKAAAVGFLMFDHKTLAERKAENRQVQNVVEELCREMPGLPNLA